MKIRVEFERNEDGFGYRALGLEWCYHGLRKLRRLAGLGSIPSVFTATVSLEPVEGAVHLKWNDGEEAWRTADDGDYFCTTTFQDRLCDQLLDYAAELWITFDV